MPSLLELMAGAGLANSVQLFYAKKTGIADNTATDLLTVTVPNATQSAYLVLFLVSANGSTDAFESTRGAIGTIPIARTAGANVVATANALIGTGIATVAAGATHTLAYAVGSVTGAVGASNSFPVTVTVDDSAGTGSNQVIVLALLINSEGSSTTRGITLAAS
jgi:hypothetical protein